MKKNSKQSRESKQQDQKSQEQNKAKPTAKRQEAKRAPQRRSGKKRQREIRVIQANGAAARAGMPERTVGIDLGDKNCYWKGILADGSESEGRIATEELAAFLEQLPASRVVMETGTHSGWAAWKAIESGHETYVANARKLPSIYQNPNKDDAADADLLARMGRLDLKMLHPVQLRRPELKADRAVLRARDQVVQTRTKLIACVRSLVKDAGGRVPECDAGYFHRHAPGAVPPELVPAVRPLIATIAELTATIGKYDRYLAKLAEQKYPDTQLMRQVHGVGPVTAMAFRLTIGDRRRFARNRAVGPYLGLTRKRDTSGEHDPALGISKAGDGYMRRLLIGDAQYILGPFGKDCDLRRFGFRLMGLGEGAVRPRKVDKNKKKRAVTAVARKLGVLLHALWTSGEVYEPLRNSQAAAARAGGDA